MYKHLHPFRSLVPLAFLVFAALYTGAQPPNNQYFIPLDMPKSPNSTQFAKYGDYPVNLYSGLPDISIPLYTVEAGGLSVPITLSYHASGLMVNEAASWVGAGWSLISGGEITRKVEGTPDEGGYLQWWKDSTQLNPTYSDADLDYLFYNMTVKNNSTYDTRPDIYSYDLPGHSGKFFFNSKAGYKIETIPYAPLAIKDVAIPFATATPIFDVTDEHGDIYIAGKTTTELTSNSNDGGSSSHAVTAFMLESMISQNRRDTISFSYQQQHIISPYQTGQLITVEDMETSVVTGNGCPTSYAGALGTPQPAGSQADVYEQDIHQINFKNGKVTFTLSSKARQDLANNGSPAYTAYPLGTVSVYSYNYGTKAFELQKQVVFYTSYYTAVQNQPGRLRLDSIQVLDKAGAITQHYRFAYNQQPVPVYTSFSKDYWGYYNGKMDNVSTPILIPQTQILYEQVKTIGGTPTLIDIGSSDPTSRDADSTKMQAGVLTDIYYPTGGHTTFTYQTNRFLDSGVMHLTGGLRVASISSYDGISNTPVVKTYQYNNGQENYFTNGLGQVINYNFFFHKAIARRFLNSPAGGGYYPCITKQVRTYYSEPTFSLTPTEGNPVAYTNVTEYVGTPGTNVGKSVYTFRYKGDEWDGSAFSTGVPVLKDYFFARGQLTSKSDYKVVSPGQYQVVKRVLNTYTAFPLSDWDAMGMVVGQAKITDGPAIVYPEEAISPDNSVFDYPFDNYAIVSDDNYLTSTTTYMFDTSDTTKYTQSAVYYAYDDTVHQQIVNVSHVDSRGNTRTSYNKYAYGYIPSGGTSTGNAVLDTMVNRNMLAEPVEKTETYTTSSGTTLTGAQLNQFKYGTITGSVVPAKVSTLSVSHPLTNFVPSGIVSGTLTGDARYLQMISFDNYDAQNNIIQYTPRNASATAILWDHTYELPVAQIKNAPNYSATVTTYAYTGFEADSKGNWTYAGAPLFDATAPAGYYSYPLSAGAITLATGVMDGTKTYVVSYWSNGAAATVNYNSTNYGGTSLKSANGWTYYEHQLPTVTGGGSLSVSGSGISIDELRLYPTNAQVTTYNYDPSGLRSISDTKGANNYFEYDYLQRLKNIKDWAGNIVKNYGYHTYDQIFGNQVQTASITRNNCPGGTTPGSLNFTVPANRYYSSTPASANADAIYDLNVNGQIKANTNCGCPVTTVTITLTNTTGLTGFQAVFSGLGTPLNFNSTSSPATFQVPVGTYATVTINDVNSSTHTYGLTGYLSQTVHNASFTTVAVVSGSPLTLSIQ